MRFVLQFLESKFLGLMTFHDNIDFKIYLTDWRSLNLEVWPMTNYDAEDWKDSPDNQVHAGLTM